MAAPGTPEAPYMPYEDARKRYRRQQKEMRAHASSLRGAFEFLHAVSTLYPARRGFEHALVIARAPDGSPALGCALALPHGGVLVGISGELCDQPIQASIDEVVRVLTMSNVLLSLPHAQA